MAILPLSDQPESGTGLSNRQLALEFDHTAAHGEGDFLVGDGNRLAHGRIMAFPDWADPVTLITGPAKAGKTHLAGIFASRSAANYVETTDLERLATQGGRQPLVIEDADRAGYDEAGLFHLLNQSMRDHRPVLITAREDVSSWPLSTDDVRSRIRRAASFEMALTDDIQLSQMFVKLFADRQIAVDPRIIGYLVARMVRSTEEAVGLVDLMDRLALARGTAITRNIAADALGRRSTMRGEAQTEQDWDTETDE